MTPSVSASIRALVNVRRTRFGNGPAAAVIQRPYAPPTIKSGHNIGWIGNINRANAPITWRAIIADECVVPWLFTHFVSPTWPCAACGGALALTWAWGDIAELRQRWHRGFSESWLFRCF